LTFSTLNFATVPHGLLHILEPVVEVGDELVRV